MYVFKGTQPKRQRLEADLLGVFGVPILSTISLAVEELYLSQHGLPFSQSLDQHLLKSGINCSYVAFSLALEWASNRPQLRFGPQRMRLHRLEGH